MAGETQGETGLAGKKTIETIKAVRLLGPPSLLCVLSVSQGGGLSWGWSISLKRSNLCCHIKGRLLLPARAVCPAPWPPGRDLTLESHPPGIISSQDLSRCEVPVAAAFSACHVWDRHSCSCPLEFAVQRSTKQLGCSLGMRTLPKGPPSPVGICRR